MRKNIMTQIITAIFLLPVLVAPLFALLPVQDGIASGAEKWGIVKKLGNNATINWTTKVVRVKGQGFGPDSVKHLGRRKALAHRAAQLDAYRNLAEAVKGVRVTSHSNVEQILLNSDSIQTKTTAMLKGMQVVEVTYTRDGGCEMTVEVNIGQDGQFILTALNKGEIKMTDNYPRFDWEARQQELARIKARYATISNNLRQKNQQLAEKDNQIKKLEEENTRRQAPARQEKSYTGLLIDARKLNLKPALAPSIINENREKIYGIGSVPTQATSGSIVEYLSGMMKDHMTDNVEGTSKHHRIIQRPLRVKGIKVINDTDIMISNEDAEKLVLIRPQLEQKKVAILL